MLKLKKEGKLPHLSSLVIFDYDQSKYDYEGEKELRLVPMTVLM